MAQPSTTIAPAINVPTFCRRHAMQFIMPPLWFCYRSAIDTGYPACRHEQFHNTIRGTIEFQCPSSSGWSNKCALRSAGRITGPNVPCGNVETKQVAEIINAVAIAYSQAGHGKDGGARAGVESYVKSID